MPPAASSLGYVTRMFRVVIAIERVAILCCRPRRHNNCRGGLRKISRERGETRDDEVCELQSPSQALVGAWSNFRFHSSGESPGFFPWLLTACFWMAGWADAQDHQLRSICDEVKPHWRRTEREQVGQGLRVQESSPKLNPIQSN